MASLEQIEAALRAADAAGNTEDAKRLAQAYADARGEAMGQAQAAPITDLAPVQAEAPNPTDGNGFFQNAAAGFGKSLVDTYDGMGQLGRSAADYFLTQNPDIGNIGRGGLSDQVTGTDNSLRGRNRQAMQQAQVGIDERHQLDAPLMQTGGGIVGNVAGQVAQMAVPVGGAGARAASAFGRVAPVAGAATRAGAFTGTQAMDSGQNRAVEMGKGAAFGAGGQAATMGLSKLASNAASRLADPVRKSIELARKAGIPLHLSQVTDSKFLKAAQAATSWLPFSGAGKAGRNQQEAFNRAVSRSFGADAKVLTEDVMKAARSDIGKVYDDVFARNEVGLHQMDLSRMAQVEKAALADLTESEAKIVSRQFDKIVSDFEAGPVSGSKYQDLRESLKGAIDESKTGKAVKALRAALDDAAFRSVGAGDTKALKKANSMWANLRTTEDALKQVSGAGGNVKPASLYPLIRKGATAEMRELAKIGQLVLKDGVGDSGTAQRMMITQALGLGGAGGVGMAGGMAALAPLAKFATVGAVAGKALNSNTASKVLAQGKPLTGLARLSKPANKLLPASAGALAAPMEIDIVGDGDPNSPATQETLRRLRRKAYGP